MERLKILELIDDLTASEIRNIQIYMDSHLFSMSKIPSKLFKNLVAQKNHYTKVALWNSIFPKIKLDENKFRKLCNESLTIIEQYLSIKHFLDNEKKTQQQLLEYYFENEIKDFFEFKIDRILKSNETNIKYGTNYYLQQYQLKHLYFIYLQNLENAPSLNISSSSDSLDLFYFTQKIKYICNAINNRNILGKDENIQFENLIISTIENSTLKENVLISIFYSIYLSQKNTDEELNFINASNLLSNNIDAIEKEEIKDIIQYLINYCIKKINQSDDLYLHELFKIYGIYLEKIQEKVFSPIRFKNIFLLALKMKKFDWALAFIDNFGNKLPTAQREITIAYNKARLFYDLKEFDKVLDALLHLQHDEVQFNLISKVLIIKTFYEKNEVQFLENYLISFRVYILRNKAMNTQNKKIHLNFIKMLKKLIKMEFASKTVIEKFKNEVTSFTNLPDKIWFLEKIEQL